MTASPSPDPKLARLAMVKNGANASYAENFIDTHEAKQQQFGVVQTCPNCRYVTRAGSGAIGGKTKAA